MATSLSIFETGRKTTYFPPAFRSIPLSPEDAFLTSGNTETIVDFWDEIDWD